MQFATDWDTHSCFKGLPVWVNADKLGRSLRFLVLGSRLLLNNAQPESCITNSQLPPGYQTTSGEWVALTPRLQLLTSPPEMVGISTEQEDGGTKIRGHSGPYRDGTLFRWAEYHQSQFRRRCAEQRLGSFDLSILNRKALQEGSTTQEYREFLRTLEMVGM